MSATCELRAKQCPKSDFYRTELEPYLGKTVNIIGTLKKVELKKYGGYYGFSLVLLKNVTIANEYQKPIDHIWILCNRHFLRENHYKINDKLLCTGKIYEYQSSGRRNLSLKLYKSVKLNCLNEPINTKK